MKGGLLDALSDSWNRNNRILLNFLEVLPQGSLEIRPMAGSPSIAELFTHIHFVRLILVSEDAPEFATTLPEKEWLPELDRTRLAEMLTDSAKAVMESVHSRVHLKRDMEVHYDHPIVLLQHLIWHEGYHHGQMKLALKLAGCPMSDAQAGPLTWRVWMNKTRAV